MEESIKMSYRSPFFDELDRHDLSAIDSVLKDLKTGITPTDKLLATSRN